MLDMTQPPDISFITKDHPEACGRQAQTGEVAYSPRWTLEDGRILCVHMGEPSWTAFKHMLAEMAIDDMLNTALDSSSAQTQEGQ